MRYVSTRGRAPERGFTEILLSGLADDGGLYVPDHYPRVTPEQLESWRSLSYAELATEIVGLYATDIPREQLAALCRATYTPAVYGNARAGSDAADITPLRWLEPGLALLELSNGPTLAFKDMAMQLLGALFELVLRERGGELNILGATSGDTGSAAEHALRGRDGIRVFMLSPQGRMSAFQRAQMYSLQDANIHNLAVAGTFDDCQDLVKGVSADLDFKSRWKIGSVNSINWGRIVAQVVYYFRGYLAATRRHGERVSFAVPSGNFGNILSGWIARSMGLPVDRLVLATNENDVLDEFFRTGRYRVRGGSETHATSSPSMDISKASNFERYVFDIVGRDPLIVRELWWEIDTRGQFHLAGTPFFEAVRSGCMVSGRSTHIDRLRTIRTVEQRYGVVIDPHTADGLKVALEHRDAAVPMICLETALPAKFSETIVEALGRAPERPAAFADIESLPQRFERIAANVDAVKAHIAANGA
ncbi:MAG TPA: threonine synthase [Burkholderiaceae bacterium]|nr:threonine synthase [Burkholderiaceae bacterium]HQR69188.1 threonine synthase [Burkholderiaceae bacterium]